MLNFRGVPLIYFRKRDIGVGGSLEKHSMDISASTRVVSKTNSWTFHGSAIFHISMHIPPSEKETVGKSSSKVPAGMRDVSQPKSCHVRCQSCRRHIGRHGTASVAWLRKEKGRVEI